MNNIDRINRIVLSEEAYWEEKETDVYLFQYNFYMRFFEIIDIDETSFNDRIYKKIEKTKDGFVKDLYETILNNLEKKHNSYIGKCYFVKLLPQRYPSRQYYESEEYESIVSRVYIPIVTNSKNSFCINDQILDSVEGHEFFSKSDDLVAIYNLGDTDIIYLSVDLIPINYFKNQK